MYANKTKTTTKDSAKKLRIIDDRYNRHKWGSFKSSRAVQLCGSSSSPPSRASVSLTHFGGRSSPTRVDTLECLDRSGSGALLVLAPWLDPVGLDVRNHHFGGDQDSSRSYRAHMFVPGYHRASLESRYHCYRESFGRPLREVSKEDM